MGGGRMRTAARRPVPLCAIAAALFLVVGGEGRAAEHKPILGKAEINPGRGAHVEEAPPTVPIAVPRMDGPAYYLSDYFPPVFTREEPSPALPSGPSAPLLGTNFVGIPYTGFFPPDPIIAAGPEDLVPVVNGGIALFTKAGLNSAQLTLNNFYAGSLSGTFVYDPKILYDPHSGRFFTVALDGQSSPNSWLRIAVSKSNNPNNLSVGTSPGAHWWGFNIDADLDGGVQVNNNWADYPGLGVDQFNLYITANMFSNAGVFQYSKVWTIPKSGLVAGGPITVFEFGAPPAPPLANPVTGFADGTIQPALNFDLTNEHMLATNALGANGNVTFWTVNTPGGTPTMSATNLLVTSWNSFSVPDCPQAGGGVPLNTGDTRMLNAVERGGSIWATHTQPNPAGTRTEARWYQINPIGPAVVQFGQVTDSTRCYFYPAIHPDALGNVSMVMSGVDGTIFGSAFYTGRLSTDPAGTMQTVALLQAGLSNYVVVDPSGRNRWGDYGGIAGDPATGEIWLFHEYASATLNQWSTWVGKTAIGGPSPRSCFQRVGDLNLPRVAHTGTLLDDGRVLILGGFTDGFQGVDSAEIYESGTFRLLSGLSKTMSEKRAGHRVVRLAGTGGNLLITGGSAGSGVPTNRGADLFDPSTETFRKVGDMMHYRFQHEMVLLSSGQDAGKVLVVGGAGGASNTAELYNPSSETFLAVGSMTAGRTVLFLYELGNGEVLAVGGLDEGSSAGVNSAEKYSSVTRTWQPLGSIPQNVFASQSSSRAYRMSNGEILFVGLGVTGGQSLPSALAFSPDNSTFRIVNLPNSSREHAQLRDGRIFVTYFDTVSGGSRAFVFDPVTETSVDQGPTLTLKSADFPSVTLNNGSVLIAGGLGPSGSQFGPNVRAAEVFVPSCFGVPVPTLSAWGMMILALLLVAVGTTVILRTRARRC
jgi:hypothetical protein